MPKKTDNSNSLTTKTKNSKSNTVKKIVKKRNRPDLKNFGQENIQPGDNTKFLKHSREILALGGKVNMKDPSLVEKRINDYFSLCEVNDVKPTVNGLALAFDIDRRTLYSFAMGQIKGNNPKTVDLIKRAYEILQNLWEDYMQNGKVNPASGIFLGKNHFGYVDEVKIVAERGDERPSDDQLLQDAEMLSGDMEVAEGAKSPETPLLPPSAADY